MLEAVRNVAQEEGDPGSRRWFADDELELILWYSASGEVVGFQLCYDLHRRERAFTWKKESGLTHSLIDSGEESPFHNRSPILISEPRAPLRQVISEFTARSGKLDQSIVELVATTISTFETSASKRPAAASVIRFALALPDHQLFDGAPVGNLLTISPDGSKLVYAAKSQLYMRRMADLEFAAIPGTAGAQNPFFSPDGEWIAFWSASRGELMKVPAGGGAAKRICRSGRISGATWSGSEIVFGHAAGVMQAADNAGDPLVLIEQRGAHNPQFLDRSKAILFTVERQVVVQSLLTKERKIILASGTHGRYVTSGHLLYVVDGNLAAVPFDWKNLEVRGDSVTVVDNVLVANFSVSDSGTLVYLSLNNDRAQLHVVFNWLEVLKQRV